MKKIKSFDGSRLQSGYHTGYVIFFRNGRYYISQESGTRLATKEEVAGHNPAPRVKGKGEGMIKKADCGHYEYAHKAIKQLGRTQCRECARIINRQLGRLVASLTREVKP